MGEPGEARTGALGVALTEEDLYKVSFQIIAATGTARSCYMEALAAAKRGDFTKSAKLMQQGDDVRLEGLEVHGRLVRSEASQGPIAMNLISSHAEDQLMGTEVIRIVAGELIDLYRHRS